MSFGLDPDPDRRAPAPGDPPPERAERNRPAYHFNHSSAFRAVYGVALSEKQVVDWTGSCRCWS